MHSPSPNSASDETQTALEQAVPEFAAIIAHDRAIVAKVLRNDKAAIEELFIVRCGPALKYLSEKRFQYEDLPGEVFQHLAANDWRRLRTWRGESSIKRWVEQVAIRICLKSVKDSVRFTPLAEFSEDHYIAEDEDLGMKSIELAELQNAIEQLPSERDRTFTRMLIIERKNIANIAQSMGITRSYADVIMFRVKKQLRELLNGGKVHA